MGKRLGDLHHPSHQRQGTLLGPLERGVTDLSSLPEQHPPSQLLVRDAMADNSDIQLLLLGLRPGQNRVHIPEQWHLVIIIIFLAASSGKPPCSCSPWHSLHKGCRGKVGWRTC